MSHNDMFNTGLDRNPGNFSALSPLSFIAWAADVYPDQPAIAYANDETTWSQTYARCRRLASALTQLGIGSGDTVAVMAPNIPPMFEAHYGIPMTGAVINALNTRLDSHSIAFMLEHGEARVLLTDTEYSATISAALKLLKNPPVVIDIEDPNAPGGERLGEIDYETFIGQGDPQFEWQLPGDEWNAIALSYTSGTTGNPKGVVTHHRGAYLNAIGNIVTWAMS
ncbi:MAG: AMP-binding protein, partial [Burkholderiales bacterium]